MAYVETLVRDFVFDKPIHAPNLDLTHAERVPGQPDQYWKQAAAARGAGVHSGSDRSTNYVAHLGALASAN